MRVIWPFPRYVPETKGGFTAKPSSLTLDTENIFPLDRDNHPIDSGHHISESTRYGDVIPVV